MNDYNTLLEQIPIEYNFFALLIFIGIGQGLMISGVILFNRKSENQPIQFLGWLILFCSFVLFDFILSYTGLMKYMLWMNNLTEIFVLFIPIFLYFFVLGLLKQEKISFLKYWKHFILPVVYFISQLGVLLQPNVVKLNNYVFSFHPHLSTLEYSPSTILSFSSSISGIFHHLLVGTFLFYLFLSSQIIKNYNTTLSKHFHKTKPAKKLQKYRFSIYITLLLGMTAIISMIVFIRYNSDLGEQYIVILPLVGIFLISGLMLSKSQLLDNAWLLEKYHTSGLNIPSADFLEKITTFVEKEKYYLQKTTSLKDLSTQLSISSTYLSQVINNQTGQNFNDFINRYRIEEAKKRLVDTNYAHLNIAGIGETVGFKSKSAFYTAFKKHTQFTPAAYAKMAKLEKNA